MPKKRDTHIIYAQILEFCQKPRPIQDIMERCGLSGHLVYEHVGFLFDRGLLEKIEVPKLRGPLFITTLKGYRYLRHFERLEKLLEGEASG